MTNEHVPCEPIEEIPARGWPGISGWRCTLCGIRYSRRRDAELCYRLCKLEQQEERG